MMDEMERRAGLYISTNGTHSDLSVVMVVALFGKSASFRLMFFTRGQFHVGETDVGCNHVCEGMSWVL